MDEQWACDMMICDSEHFDSEGISVKRRHRLVLSTLGQNSK